MNCEDRLSSLERRLDSIERYTNPTRFRKVEIIPTFPIHDAEFPEDLVIHILAHLSKKEYFTCKLVCKRWDSLRHSVAAVRKAIATPLKVERCIQYSKNRTGSGPWQWSGWQKSIPRHLWIRVSCWIKFVGEVPAPSSNFGLKLHGRVDNSWVRNCRPNTWTYISSVAQATGGDGNHILLIFDSIQESTVIRFTELRLEIIDSPQAQTPIKDYVAFTSSDLSKQYVAMGINRKGIPAVSGAGSMDFVSDYPKQKIAHL